MGVDAAINGTAGNYSLSGLDGDEVIEAQAGHDTVNAGAGTT